MDHDRRHRMACILEQVARFCVAVTVHWAESMRTSSTARILTTIEGVCQETLISLFAHSVQP